MRHLWNQKIFFPLSKNFNPSFLSTPNFCQLLKMVNPLYIPAASSISKWTTINTISTLNHLLAMMKLIDSLRILPKNRLLLHQRYILSKLSWHLTVANLCKTWVIENLDNVVVRFVRKWLDLPNSATLSGISLPRNQFGLNLLLPSVKFLQC